MERRPVLLLAATLLLSSACGGERVEAPARASATPPEFLAAAESLLSGQNRYLGRARLEEDRAKLERSGLTPDFEVRTRLDLANELLEQGEIPAALAELERVGALMKGAVGLRHRLDEFERAEALARLREAEIENCVKRHNGDCCLFPIAGGGVHTQRRPATRALELYLGLLQRSPEDPTLIWLANVVAMTLGEHPRAVPERFRIPPASFASEHDVGRFVNVAEEVGVADSNLCGGVAIDDFDGDGRLDIFTTTSHPREHAILYRGLGGMRFENATAAAGLEGQLGGLNCVAADYDGDGDTDVLVLRGAWLFDDGRIRNSLLRNEGDGTFTDVTEAAGLAAPAAPTQAACFGDFDLDGDLDLYVVNESRRELGDPPGGDYPAQFFVNRGDGTFEERAEAAGLTNDRYAKGVACGDYDDDGDLDIYVSNIGRNRLYRNDGDGTFTDVASELGVSGPRGRSFACWFFDYDNDGRLDIFVGAYEATVGDVACDYLGRPHEGVAPCLYRNEGGRFRDVASEVGLDRPFLPMGASFGDLDNDGFLDIYLATGEPSFEALVPNVMLRNDRGRRFQDVTESGGFGHLQKGHGVAFADLDGDGDQDVFNQLGGFYPGDTFRNALFQNPGHEARFLKIRLVGRESPRCGHGARIAVAIREGGERRTIHRAVGSVSSFGSTPARQEIGLGRADSIESVTVRWPRGATQTSSGVPLDAEILVTEGREGFERRDG